MSRSEPRALCVAIHDVAPATLGECLHLLRAMREVADIPMSWLVVPHYHHSDLPSHALDVALEALRAQGHELVLHGYTHLDPCPVEGSMFHRWLRAGYTRREGEFSALTAAEARRRIELGLAWFRARGWEPDGFVAPAWLLGREAWSALADYPFRYTTTYARFHLLRPGHAARSQLAPALVYAARNWAGRAVSPPAVRLLAELTARAPLVRLALHPRDAHFPALVRHAQSLLEQLLRSRTPMSKIHYAHLLGGHGAPAAPTNTAPSGLPTPNDGAHTKRCSSDARSAPCRPWH